MISKAKQDVHLYISNSREFVFIHFHLVIFLILVLFIIDVMLCGIEHYCTLKPCFAKRDTKNYVVTLVLLIVTNLSHDFNLKSKICVHCV